MLGRLKESSPRKGEASKEGSGEILLAEAWQPPERTACVGAKFTREVLFSLSFGGGPSSCTCASIPLALTTNELHLWDSAGRLTSPAMIYRGFAPSTNYVQRTVPRQRCSTLCLTPPCNIQEHPQPLAGRGIPSLQPNAKKRKRDTLHTRPAYCLAEALNTGNPGETGPTAPHRFTLRCPGSARPMPPGSCGKGSPPSRSRSTSALLLVPPQPGFLHSTRLGRVRRERELLLCSSSPGSMFMSWFSSAASACSSSGNSGDNVAAANARTLCCTAARRPGSVPNILGIGWIRSRRLPGGAHSSGVLP